MPKRAVSGNAVALVVGGGPVDDHDLVASLERAVVAVATNPAVGWHRRERRSERYTTPIWKRFKELLTGPDIDPDDAAILDVGTKSSRATRCS